MKGAAVRRRRHRAGGRRSRSRPAPTCCASAPTWTPPWSRRWRRRSPRPSSTGALDAARVEEAAARTAALAAWASAPAPGPASTGSGVRRRAAGGPGGGRAAPGWSRRWWSQLSATSTIAEGRVPWGLGPHLNGTEQIRVVAASIVGRGDPGPGRRPADLVIVARHAHRLTGAAALIEELAGRHAGGRRGDGLARPRGGRPARGRSSHLRRQPRQRPRGRRRPRPAPLTPAPLTPAPADATTLTVAQRTSART